MPEAWTADLEATIKASSEYATPFAETELVRNVVQAWVNLGAIT